MTVHHLDRDPANCQDWNLAALCQRCHLQVQNKVTMDQLFFDQILTPSAWFKDHYTGYLKAYNLCPRGKYIPRKTDHETAERELETKGQ